MTWNLNPPYEGAAVDFDPDAVEVYTNLEHEPEVARVALRAAADLARAAVDSVPDGSGNVRISASGTCAHPAVPGSQATANITVQTVAKEA